MSRRTLPRSTPELGVAELSLLALTLAAVAGFGRVLAGDWWGPLAAVAVVAHGTAVVARRRGLGVPTAAAAEVVTCSLALLWTVFPHTTVLGLPTGDTLGAVDDALGSAWRTFQDATPPAPVEPGLLLAAGLAVAVAAFLADWAALRLWSPYEAMVPATSLFVFCALLGEGRGELAVAGAFAATAVAFLLCHRVARQARSSAWVTPEVQRASRATLLAGAGLGSLALVAGLVVGPALPGADDEAVISWESDPSGPGQRVTISPLVDIRGRLVDQPDVEVFTVQATERSYWRLTSLDTFEDGIWKSSGRYRAVDGPLPSGEGSVAPMTRSDQVFQIEALAALWLPAAFEPRRVEAPGDVRYHAASGTLIVDTDVADSDGMAYRVASDLPRFTAERLRTADAEVPGDVADQYLTLPDDVPALATTTAQEVAGGGTTPYDRARALQDWFQSSFTYDLDVGPGHGGDAIEQFLSARRGYCEQFAGTFAVMARSLGIPARVAVGFTPGEVDPDDPQTYHVRGEHAHAWPEVWLGQFGWVPFEPTPGRGAPGAEDHTGLPEAQDTSGPVTAPTTATTATTLPPTPDGSPTPDPSTTLAPAPQGEVPSLPTGDGTGTPLVVQVLGVALLLAVAYVALTPVALATRRRRRRQRAQGTEAQVRLAWVEALEDLAAVGAVHRPQETNHEFADRAAGRLPEAADRLGVLATDADAAAFAPGGLDPAVAGRSRATATAVHDAVGRRLSRPQRLARWLDPRPLLGRPGTGRHRVGPR